MPVKEGQRVADIFDDPPRGFPVKQHYIPQMLLRNFSGSSGALYIHDKVHGVGYWTIPKNVFYSEHLYTSFETDSNSGTRVPSKKYEDILGDLEGDTATVLRECFRQVRSGRTPRVFSFYEETLKRFIITQARRTPESQARVQSGVGFQDAYYEVARRMTSAEGIPLPEKDQFLQHPEFLALGKLLESSITGKFAVGEHPHESHEEERFLRETGLSFAVSRLPGEEFIIGSHGIAIVPGISGGIPFQDSWLPVARDIAIRVTGTPGELSLLELDNPSRDAYLIRAVNRASAKPSKVIAGRHEPLVRLFAREPLAGGWYKALYGGDVYDSPIP